MFFDEFGFSFQERPGPTWAPRGQRPVLRRVTRDRRGITTAVGLTLSGQIYKRHFLGGMKSPQVIQAVQHLLRFRPAGFILVWDRARIHLSRMTQAFLAAHPEIKPEELPGYAPELNPEEYCHGNVKQRSKNATPINTTDVRRLLDTGFARLRQRPDLLLSFVHAAGLSVRQLWLL